MKVCIIQPEYSLDYSRADEMFEKECGYLDKCDNSMDIIVLPESSDIPVFADSKEKSETLSGKFLDKLLYKAKETAKRCNSILFFNGREKCENGLRNTTYAIDRAGKIVGKYYKEHLVPSEVSLHKLDSKYTFEPTFPTVIEIEGIRFGFLTCYDFYFYENFSNIARENLDIIIGCSHQRSDRHSALEIITRFLAYNTNAFVLRSSVSMDINSDIGGGSMVVSPNGDILLNMKSRVGMETVDIDIGNKYFKPAGFGNPPAAHYEYIEKGRRPWKYRPCGSFVVPGDDTMPYPRICAHGGFSDIAPKNSLPSFAAAIALGANEIEFDVYETKDGEIVSVMDCLIDSISNGNGTVYEKTYSELLKYDFGFIHSDKFKGLKITSFEDILKKFTCQCIMNIHIKDNGEDYAPSDNTLKKIISLIHKYDCQKHIYFTIDKEELIIRIKEFAPDIPICCAADKEPENTLDRAIKYGCKKILLTKEMMSDSVIKEAKKHGIICNVYFADDQKSATDCLDMGIDTIITNECNIVNNALKEYFNCK